jgi:hypothetical protein
MTTTRNPRFALIEAVLSIYGRIMRVHLQRAFGFAPAAATRLLADYREAHPEGITFDTVLKCYVKGQKFKTAELQKFNVDEKTFYDAACVMAGEPIVVIENRVA